jgi:hypothetical protein
VRLDHFYNYWCSLYSSEKYEGCILFQVKTRNYKCMICSHYFFLNSTFASVATACLLAIVCVVSISMTDSEKNIHTVRHDLAIAQNIPIAFSTFSFSYCGHVIYPHLEASMMTPKRWSKVLLVSTCVISIMYFTMCFVCYLEFGDQVQSPVYKSLPIGKKKKKKKKKKCVSSIIIIRLFSKCSHVCHYTSCIVGYSILSLRVYNAY